MSIWVVPHWRKRISDHPLGLYEGYNKVTVFEYTRSDLTCVVWWPHVLCSGNIKKSQPHPLHFCICKYMEVNHMHSELYLLDQNATKHQ